MPRLSSQEAKNWYHIYETEGLVACRQKAGTNAEAIIACEGLDYNYYLGEARAIQMELEKGHVDLAYFSEKMRHLADFAGVLTRYEPKPKKFWDKVHSALEGK